MDRHALTVLQRAVKQKARKAGRSIEMNGERIVYCFRCLRSNYEVTWMAWEPFFVICDECIRDLSKFMEHSLEKQKLAQAQSESNEAESSEDRQAERDAP